MNQEAIKQLQRIKGIGAVLAKRLVEKGFDSPARLAEADPEILATVPGLHLRYLPSIIEQARSLSEEPAEAEAAGTGNKSEALRRTAAELRQRVRELVDGLLARKADDLDESKKNHLDRETDKFLARLERVESCLNGCRKRARKGLARSARRLDGLETVGAGKLAQGLKKARKPFKRILA